MRWVIQGAMKRTNRKKKKRHQRMLINRLWARLWHQRVAILKVCPRIVPEQQQIWGHLRASSYIYLFIHEAPIVPFKINYQQPAWRKRGHRGHRIWSKSWGISVEGWARQGLKGERSSSGSFTSEGEMSACSLSQISKHIWGGLRSVWRIHTVVETCSARDTIRQSMNQWMDGWIDGVMEAFSN